MVKSYKGYINTGITICQDLINVKLKTTDISYMHLDKIGSIFYYIANSPKNYRGSVHQPEYRQILNACRADDVAGAVAALEAHLHNSAMATAPRSSQAEELESNFKTNIDDRRDLWLNKKLRLLRLLDGV